MSTRPKLDTAEAILDWVCEQSGKRTQSPAHDRIYHDDAEYLAQCVRISKAWECFKAKSFIEWAEQACAYQANQRTERDEENERLRQWADTYVKGRGRERRERHELACADCIANKMRDAMDVE